MDKSGRVVIIGAGISGLATAFWLTQSGQEVVVLERKPEVGGAMETVVEKGFLFDRGPNSGLETTPLIRELARAVGIEKEMVYASRNAKNRYILRNGELHALPMGPVSLFRSKLFSRRGKFRILLEPFVGKSGDGYYQSVADFVRRRLGSEFLDYAINPFVSGVFAGDPEKLSVASAFPKLYRLEEVYGGLIKGMIKGAKERKKRAERSKQSAEMFTFFRGMQSFPEAIAQHLRGKVHTGVGELHILESGRHNFKVSFRKNGKREEIQADAVISAVPAYAAAKLLGGFDSGLKAHLEAIDYPPVMVLFLGYRKNDIGRPLDGFGFLIPQKEEKSFLGAIWSSAIFPNRAGDGYAAFTLFIGGALHPEIFDQDQEKLIQKVIGEFEEIMRISGKPVYQASRFWEKAIPQYNLGYIEHIRAIERFEEKNPGLFLTGNYRGGISVGDCVKNSKITAERVLLFLSRSEKGSLKGL